MNYLSRDDIGYLFVLTYTIIAAICCLPIESFFIQAFENRENIVYIIFDCIYGLRLMYIMYFLARDIIDENFERLYSHTHLVFIETMMQIGMYLSNVI